VAEQEGTVDSALPVAEEEVADVAMTARVVTLQARKACVKPLEQMSLTTASQKAAADQMQTSWEKIAECVGTTNGQDTSKNELQNIVTVVIAEPVHSPAKRARQSLEMVRQEFRLPEEPVKPCWRPK
jgi:hypothetical protein